MLNNISDAVFDCFALLITVELTFGTDNLAFDTSQIVCSRMEITYSDYTVHCFPTMKFLAVFCHIQIQNTCTLTYINIITSILLVSLSTATIQDPQRPGEFQ